jgi:hypothetical protein
VLWLASGLEASTFGKEDKERDQPGKIVELWAKILGIKEIKTYKHIGRIVREEWEREWGAEGKGWRRGRARIDHWPSQYLRNVHPAQVLFHWIIF